MIKLKISTGRSVRSNAIRQQDISVKQLFKKLSEPEIKSKKDGKYFIFASFKKDIRNAQNVDKYYGATIDLDDTPLSISEVRKLYSKYQYCIHTTFNHKAPDKGIRYRLILPYKKPQESVKHVQTLMYIMYTLGLSNVDLSSKALSRPMYLPAAPSSRKKYFEFFKNEKGILFNPDHIEITPEMQWEMDQQADDQEQLEPVDLNKEITQGERNHVIARIVGKFIKNGMDLNTIHQSTLAWNDRNCLPPLADKDVKTIVNSIYKTHKRNHKDSGWGYDELVRRVTESKNPTEDYSLLIELISGSYSILKKSQLELLIRKLNAKSKVPLSVIRDELKEKSIEKQYEKEDDKNENDKKSVKDLKKQFKDYIYLRKDDRIYNSKNGLIYKVEGFNRASTHLIDKGTLLNLLLKFKSIKQADMLQFFPGKENIYSQEYITYANTYISPDIFPLPGDVSPMIDHFEYLIPSKRERDIVLDYIAYLIQNPGNKIRWMPILKGWKGVGKSIIIELILEPLLGANNVKPVSSRMVKGDFNSWQLDTQLVAFHELKLGTTRKETQEMTDSLKEFITEPTMLAHRKGIDAYKVINKSNVFGLTNHEDAIVITDDERRFSLIRIEAKKKEATHYIYLCNWLKANVEEMYYYYINRDVSKFDHYNAPSTRYTDEVKEASEMWPTSILREALKDSNHQFNTIGVITWAGLVAYIKSESTGRDMMIADNLIKATSSQGYRLMHALKELGFRKYEPSRGSGSDRITIKGNRQRVWIAPDKISKFRNMSSRRVGRLLKNEKTIYDFD